MPDAPISTPPSATKKRDHFDAARDIVAALSGLSPDQKALAIKFACETEGIANPVARSGGGGSGGGTSGGTPAGAGAGSEAKPPGGGAAPVEKPVDIKSFVESKRPKNDNQFVVVVAYYHRFEAPTKVETINKDLLVDAIRMTGWRRMARPAQTLVNAKHDGYLNSKGNGEYAINHVGENLVVMTLGGGNGGAKKADK